MSQTRIHHSRMLTNRRKKQTAKKQLVGLAKRAKKLAKQNVKTAGADAPKKPAP